MVRTALSRLAEERTGVLDRLESDPRLARALVAVLAASRSLSRLCLQEPAAIEVLAALDHRPHLEAGTPEALAAWKRLELLRIAASDLVGNASLEAVGGGLATLADDVLGAAWKLAGEPELTVVAMGKLGGRELNYASDVDVVFAGPGESERGARRVMEVARTCFRVDADLRPEGRSGALVRTVESFSVYWQRWAEGWERQALIKARPAAGSEDIGRNFTAAAQDALWGRPFGAEELGRIRSVKARSEEEVRRRGLEEREVKRGRGGIRDIELAVQLLQLVHGRQDTGLRSPTTLDALRELGSAGYVAASDARALSDAYRFLREVEHRLQLVEEAQTHALPAESEARATLARVMGYRDRPTSSALARFDEDVTRHQVMVRFIHERLFFRPLLEVFGSRDWTGGGGPTLSPRAAEERLAAFGFGDSDRTRAAIGELTRGLTRRSRLMQQMLPLLLGWLSEGPDPDLGLLGLRTLATGQHRRERLLATFRDSPEAARRLCLLLSTSRLLLDPLEHNPELIPDLGDDEALARRGRADLLDRAGAALAWRAEPGARHEGLFRLSRTELLRIAARDLLVLDDVATTAQSLTDLAEAVVEAALASLEPKVAMAVIAVGRFGGVELSYASDLDVLLVFDAASAGDVAEAERTATSLVRLVKGDTPSERLYALDTALRPEGANGPLARSLEGYRTYWQRWAQVWERQSLVRARPVAGDRSVGARFMELAEPFVWSSPLDDDGVRAVRRMKARVERERIPPGEDPQFHLKLGRGSLSDVEWTAQLLQLRYGVRSPGTMAALGSLVAGGHLDGSDAAVLGDAYRFCERTRNRLFLVQASAGDSLPRQADQLSRLARSLSTTPVGLREEYRRVTRRARRVMERLFYGIDPPGRAPRRRSTGGVESRRASR